MARQYGVSQPTTPPRPDAPVDPPALFVGGPWHCRIQTISCGYSEYRVPLGYPIGDSGTAVYHAQGFHLGGGNVIRVYTLHNFVTEDQVYTALAEIAGLLPPGTTLGGQQ